MAMNQNTFRLQVFEAGAFRDLAWQVHALNSSRTHAAKATVDLKCCKAVLHLARLMFRVQRFLLNRLRHLRDPPSRLRNRSRHHSCFVPLVDSLASENC